MTDNFQVEFPQSEQFQSKLKMLSARYSRIHGSNLRVNKILSLSLQALQNIPAEKIEEFKHIIDPEDQESAPNIFRKTSNLDGSDRAILETIRLHLLTNQKKDFSRKEIILAIILLAHSLNDDDISYILSEYH